MCCKTKESLLQYYIGKPMSVFAQIESHCKQLIQHRGLFLDSIAKRHLETMLKSVKIQRITLQHCLDYSMRLWISTIKNCFKIYVGIHRYRNDSSKA